jgi:hypothetical protein
MSIRVTTDIPHGNVADVEIVERDGISEVLFSAHPNGGTEALWFCFRVTIEGNEIPDTVRLTLRHPDTLLGSPRSEKVRPVIRRSDQDWERINPGLDTELPDGRWTVSWDVENPSTTLDMAFCYPYGKDELHATLRDIAGVFRPDRIGVSQGGRPMVRLSNDYGTPESDRPGIYITARQHSGETPGSWVMDGLIREMSRVGESAPLIWVVPFTNIDGVIEGDYGKDPFPWDLNRAWTASPMRHEVMVLRNDINRWRERCRPVFALDLHAPGASETEGIYGFVPDPARATVAYREVMRWFEPIAESLGEYASLNFAKVAHYATRWGTGSVARYFESVGVPAISLETTYALIGERIITRDDYREIGARIARAIIDKLKG